VRVGLPDLNNSIVVYFFSLTNINRLFLKQALKFEELLSIRDKRFKNLFYCLSEALSQLGQNFNINRSITTT